MAMNPGQPPARWGWIGHARQDAADHVFCVVITSLLDHEAGQHVCGVEQTAIEDQAPAKAGLDFTR